jgi:photosystem II stability/assembly factor-like uncharacterized protein
LATIKRAFLAHDSGRTWSELTIPSYVTGIYDFTMTPDSSLWLATREGAVRSTNGGEKWVHVMNGLPSSGVLAVMYDAHTQRLVATAMKSKGVYESADGGKTWTQTPEASFSIRSATVYQGQLLATSWHNGLLLQRTNAAAKAPSASANATNTAAPSQR